MGKAVLLSIKPKWCEKILNGEKKIEIRKTKPNLESPFKCYIYCTKRAGYTDKLWVLTDDARQFHYLTAVCANLAESRGHSCGNSKVVAEFVCDKIIDVDCDSVAPFDYDTKEYIPDCCVSRKELIAYCGMKRPFGWQISSLKVFDKPKEINAFHQHCTPACNFSNECGGSDTKECLFEIKRAPMSWCYVEELK